MQYTISRLEEHGRCSASGTFVQITVLDFYVKYLTVFECTLFVVCFGVAVLVTKSVKHNLGQTPRLAASHRRVKYMGQLHPELISNELSKYFNSKLHL